MALGRATLERIGEGGGGIAAGVSSYPSPKSTPRQCAAHLTPIPTMCIMCCMRPPPSERFVLSALALAIILVLALSWLIR